MKYLHRLAEAGVSADLQSRLVAAIDNVSKCRQAYEEAAGALESTLNEIATKFTWCVMYGDDTMEVHPISRSVIMSIVFDDKPQHGVCPKGEEENLIADLKRQRIEELQRRIAELQK